MSKKSAKIDLRAAPSQLPPVQSTKSRSVTQAVVQLAKTVAASSRHVRVVASIVVVICAFCLYRWVAVPLIEPTIDLAASLPATEEMIQRAKEANLARLRDISSYFNEGDWERDNPTIMESGRAKLLIKEYYNQGADGIRLVPCTIVFQPKDEPEAGPSSTPRVIILQAEQALLRFDRVLDLSRGEIGKLIGGSIAGPITIRGVSTTPDGQEDLLVTTRDVELKENVISTPHDVQFRFGPNHGQGTGLKIALAPSQGSGTEQGSPNIGGADYLQLERNVRMHIVPGNRGLLPGDRSLQQPRLSNAPAADLPVDVHCQGHFRFDVVRNIASFHDQVNVVRNNQVGAADQMTCETLAIHFARQQSTGPDRPRNSSLDGLKPSRLEAEGTPLIIHAPSTQAEARGRRLTYEIQSDKVTLEGEDGVILRQKFSQVQARRVEYAQAAENEGRIGDLNATGPGWFRQQDPDGTVVEASWQEHLIIQTAQDLKVMSMRGKARLNSSGQGTLTADELHFWFSEMPDRPAQSSTQPNGLLAQSTKIVPYAVRAIGNVEIDGPQMQGGTGELTLRFVQRQGDGLQSGASLAQSPQQLAGIAQPQQDSRSGRGLAYREPTERLRIHGSSIHAELEQSMEDPAAGRAELRHARIKGAARLEQISTRDASRSLLVTGDEVQLLHASQLVVSGKPAEVDSNGMKLAGNSIRLNTEENWLWIDGPGRMQLPMTQDLNGQRLDRPSILEVTWRQSMNFDGLIATFNDQVVVQSAEQTLRTDEMRVRLKSRIDFSQSQRSGDSSTASVDQIDCMGPFDIESRTRKDGQLIGIERLNARDLIANTTSGAIQAMGPGTAISYRVGTPNAVVPGAPQQPSENNQRYFTRIDFQDRLAGNSARQQMTFHRGIKVVRGPVANWDSVINADLHGPGPDDLLMTCNELTVSQLTAAGSSTASVQMAAVGNVKVETSRVDASAHRVTFEQAKNLLVMDSDGNNDVQLFQKSAGSGAGNVNAGKIHYYTDTGKVETYGFGYSGYGRVGQQDGGNNTTR